MSSRTAAGRKRLASAEEKDRKGKSSAKAFFFNKKNTLKLPIDPIGQPHGHYLSTTARQAAVEFNPYLEEPVPKPDATYLQRSRAYDHPIHPQYAFEHTYQSQFQNFNPPSSVTDSHNQSHVTGGENYFEASYQPPPPSRSNPGPHPTSSPTKSKAGLAASTVATVEPPPSYAFPGVSAVSLPMASLLPLQVDTSAFHHQAQTPIIPSSSIPRVPSPPEASELPAYSKSNNADFGPQYGRNGQRIGVGDNTASGSQPQIRPQHQQYLLDWTPPSLTPIPAATARTGVLSQTVRAPVPLRPENPLVLDQGPTLRSNSPESFNLSFSTPRKNIAASIISNSSQSSKSLPPTPHSSQQTFVFPGGRSGARPKVSNSKKEKDALQVKLLPVGRSSSGKRDATLRDGNRSGSPAPTSSSGERSIRRALVDGSDAIIETSRFSEDSLHNDSKGTKVKPAMTAMNGAFIHPSSRAKGAPQRPPISLKLKTKHSNGSGDLHKKRFLGLALMAKKKGKGSENASFVSLTSLESDHSWSPPPPITDGLDRTFTNRIGQSPLDPRDPILLDNDRHTGELLSFINPNSSPSFYNYGNIPPTTVLDLGCGQGHWMVDAAIAWKGYGTKIIGYDLVDLTSALIPWANKRGVLDNIEFVKGNFLTERLPFADNSFELVRLSCLSLCIAADSWPFVLQEVFRVLMVGGRLELIDDLIMFPYGKSFSVPGASSSATSQDPPARIEIPSHSARFTTYNIHDQDFHNPTLGPPIQRRVNDADFYRLYGLQEEDEEEDEDEGTLVGHDRHSNTSSPRSKVTSRYRKPDPVPEISPEAWQRAQSSALDMEAVFDHMLANKFGIHRDPSEFLLDLLDEVFGHARLLRTMHLTLPPAEHLPSSPKSTRRGSFRHSSQASGLVLWPATFIPMEQEEIDAHASKNLRILLAAKQHLVEHALEATNDDEINERTVLDAIADYESFLRHRFNPPPSKPSEGADVESDTPDYQQDLWEIQSEFREHFVWGDEKGLNLQQPAVPMSPIVQEQRKPPVLPLPSPPASPLSPTLSRSRGDRRARLFSPSTPLYPPEELTHIRTFRIYEAIKLDGSIFSAPQN